MIRRFSQRPQHLAVWLALILAVCATLAVQAFRADRSHRRVAREALANYAQLAASALAERIEIRFGAYTCGALAGLAVTLDAESPAPSVDPRELLATTGPRMQAALSGVRAIRRLSLAGAAAEDEAIVAALRPRIADRTADDPDWGAVLRKSHRFAYRLFTDDAGQPSRAWIFLFDPDSLAQAFRADATVAPLLPSFLLEGPQDPTWLRWAIETAQGERLAASSNADSLGGEFVAHDDATRVVDGLVARVQLDASAAGALVSGGVPASTLPQTLALLVASIGLLLGAYAQIRREAAAARMREDFLASVSHDLRTPLAHIRLFAETVRLGRVRDDGDRERALEIVERESLRLTHLVDNVLLASRSGRGVLTAERRRADVGSLARDVAKSFEALAAVREMSVVYAGETELHANVDPDLVRQALLNVLDNAVKYGRPGQAITVSAEGVDGRIRLRVDDAGPGIPAPDRDRVFDRFFRLERDRGAAIAGSGLGLAVVRDIAGLHEGTVGVEDSPAGGARVVISFPLTPEASR